MTLDKTLMIFISLYCKLDISHRKYTCRLVFQVSRDFQTHANSAALHYLFKEGEANERKLNPETEISHTEKKPTLNSQKFTENKAITNEIENNCQYFVKIEPEILVNCDFLFYSTGSSSFNNKHNTI